MSNQIYANFEKRIKYNVNTTHIETSPDGQFTSINNNLVLNVDDDLLNDDFLTIDNMGVVSKSPKSSLNIYDQELNSFNQVVFQRMCIQENFLADNVDADVCVFSDQISSLTLDTSASSYPSFSITDRGALNGDGLTFCFGYFRDKNTGFASASETQWVSMGRGHNTQNLLISGSSTPQVLGELVTDELQIMDISVNEVIIQRPLKLNNIPFQTVFIAQNILTLNNLNVVEKSNAVIDTFGNYTSSGFMTVGTPTLAPELITEWVLIKEGSNLIRKVALDDLFGQSLSSTGTPAFTSINIGSATPALDTRAQLKVSGPAGSNTPIYPNENLGGRVEIFNDTNPSPLASLNAYNDIDQSLAFGTYGSINTPWKKSSPSFFKYQRNNDIFGLYTNTNNTPIGSAATDKPIVIYKNIGLNAGIEYHQPIKLLSTASGPTNTRYLTLDSNDNLQERLLPAFGTGNVDWVGGVSIDNSIARYDSTTGLIIQGSGVIIDDINK